MLHRGHVILGDGVQHVADEQVLVGVAHRQQRRAIVAVHGGGQRGDRRVKQGRGGVYRHFTNARATIVISHTQADYRHFRFTAALSPFRLRLRGGQGRPGAIDIVDLPLRHYGLVFYSEGNDREGGG